MKNIYLAGIIFALIMFVSLVFAHSGSETLLAPQQEEVTHCGVSYDEMNEMHEEMISSIDNPELVLEMNEMHNSYLNSYGGHMGGMM